MRLRYEEPAAHLRRLVGCYYELEADDATRGFVRAEGPNLRCILRGEAILDFGDETFVARAPRLVLIGPSTRAYGVTMSAGTLVFGAGLTPHGWAAAVAEQACDLADQAIPYDDIHPKEAAFAVEMLCLAKDAAARVEAANAIVDATARGRALPAGAEAFIQAASAWMHADVIAGIGELSDACDLSLRQTERLSNTWFGAGPKLMQRKYRALRTSDRIARLGPCAFADVADPTFTDQSHMIREFRRFIGYTPGQFGADDHLVMREALAARDAVADRDGIRFIA